MSHCSGGSAVYGLGLIGALFYFLKGATSLWLVLVGIAKALVWPAIVVYWLLNFLGL